MPYRWKIISAASIAIVVTILAALMTVVQVHSSDLRNVNSLLATNLANKHSMMEILAQKSVRSITWRKGLAEQSVKRMLSDRAGLGETGESYLVRVRFNTTTDEDECTLTSESRYSMPLQSRIPCSESIIRAKYEGIHVEEWTLLVRDYRGVEVFSAGREVLRIGGMKSVLIVEIDKQEAMAHMWNMTRLAAVGAAIMVALIVATAFILCTTASRQLQSREKIKARNKILLAAFEATTAAIIIFDSKGIIRMSNVAARDLFLYPNLRGMNVIDLVPEQYRYNYIERLQQCATSVDAPNTESSNIQGLKAGGFQFPMLMVPSMIDSNLTVGVMQDLSEIVRLRNEMDEIVRMHLATQREIVRIRNRATS